MRKGGLVALCLLVVFVFSGCRDTGLIAQGGGLLITPGDLQFEVYNLGPSYKFDDNYQGRLDLVENLATRYFLAEEAFQRGYGDDALAEEIRTAEATAAGEAYKKWKVEGRVRVPRVESRQVLTRLDRKLHVKQIVFAVFPIAEEASRELAAGESFDTLAGGLTGREDVTFTDLGWKLWRDIDRNLAVQLFNLEVGQVTGVIRGQRGYSIYYLAEDEPSGADQRLMFQRSKRFVRWLQEAALTQEMRRELGEKFHVVYSGQGTMDALRSFAIAFGGQTPPEDLLGVKLVTYEVSGKQVAYSVGYFFNYYWSLPQPSRPYVGDPHGVEEFALDTILPELTNAAGYGMGLARVRQVVWSTKKTREEFLIPKMEDFFRSQVQVGEDEVAAYFDTHRSELAKAFTYHVRRILVASESQADEVLNELRAGRDFAQIATEKSIDTNSAPKGGDLGYIEVGMFSEYDSVAKALKPGEISGALPTSEGFEILKIEEKIPPRLFTFDESREYIATTVADLKTNDLLQSWVAEKKKSVGYVVNTDLVARIDLPEPSWKASLVKESEETEATGQQIMGRKARERARRSE